jgi:general secretion pathway protein M
MRDAFNTWFEQRAPREQRLFAALAALAVVALVWWLAVAPALQTYRETDAAHAKLDAELAQMQAMAEEAKQLKAKPRISSAQAQVWLEGSIKKLGVVSMTMQGSRAHISFVGATPEALAGWLAEARSRAQLLPVQANWKRSANGADLLWDGSLVMADAGP